MMLQLSILCIWCSMLTVNALSNFTVNQQNGNDSFKCISQQNISCQSLNFVLLKTFAFNVSSINIEIIGNYNVNENILLEGNPPFIKNISIFSTGNTVITSKFSNKSFLFNSDYEEASYQIKFDRLTFTRFGYLQAAVIVSFRVPLFISNCNFKMNWCAALNVLDAAVNLHSNIFYNNTGSAISKGAVAFPLQSFPFSENSAGGGVALIFMNTTSLYSSIQNNSFILNRAVTVATKASVIAEGDSADSFSFVGGGLLLGFLEVASYLHVLMSHNEFKSNEATLGGGLMMAFSNESGFSSIDINGCQFLQNTASSSGGGFAFAAWKKASHNNINIANSVFSYNFAQVGGGGKVLFQSADIQDPTSPAYQIFKFKNITFFANEAASASGIHLCYNLARSGTKPIYPVIFHNVTFKVHKNVYYKSARRGPSGFSGVLLSNRVDIIFQGNNMFFNNSFESPVYLSNADLHLEGNLTFHKNHAQTSGGGLSLADVSYVIMQKDSVLLFQENYAQVQGGGMFVKTIGFPDLVYKYNPSCFIQYQYASLPPSQWEASIQFIKNGAGLKGAAIFSNTITPCIWDENPPYFNFKKALRWKEVFFYSNNYLTNQRLPKILTTKDDDVDIATDTTHFDMGFSQGQVVKASPGQNIDFFLSSYDELSNQVYSVPLASVELLNNKSNDLIQLSKNYFIIGPNNRANQTMSYEVPYAAYQNLLNGKPIIEKINFIDSYSSFLSNASFTIKVVKCKPGFIYRDNTCVCDTSINGVVRCDDVFVYLKPNYWGYLTKDGLLATLKCPRQYCECKFNKSNDGCVFNYLNQNLQCAQNRVGVLCGQCESTTGLNLMTYKCVKCSNFYWSVIVISILIVSVIVISVVVLLLNPRFSSHMRGILFFVQMLPYVCSADNDINRIILAVISWLGLGGMTSFPLDQCFLESFNSLDAITLGYVYPVLILIVLLVIYFLHNHYLITFRRDSPFQSFWILIVLMYKFAVETSLLLLFCTPMNNKYVFYYDGSVQCFVGRHLIMTAVAVFVLILAVIPPLYVILILRGYLKAGPAITDGLSQGLKEHVRWWWSFDFLRRIVFISIFVFTSDWNLKQSALLISCIIVLTIHSHMHPYVNKQANNGETFLLFVLTCLVALNENTETQSYQNNLQAGLLIVSTVYCFFTTLYLCFMFIIKVCRSRVDKDCQSKSSLEDSENYDKLDDEIKSLRTHSALKRLLSRKQRVLAHRRALPSPTVTRNLLADDDGFPPVKTVY